MSKFEINTKKLQSLVQAVSRCASNNKYAAMTSLIFIELKNNTLSMTTTDMNMYLTVSESEVIGDDVTFTVGITNFSKLVSKTTTDSVSISVSDDEISFTGNGTYKIPIQLDVDGSPISFPTHYINSPEASGEIEVSTIKNIILHNKPSLALTMEAPHLTGYMCTESGYVISADSFNICLNNVETFGKNILLQPKILDILSYSLPEKLTFKISENNILFEGEGIKLFSRTYNESDTNMYPVDKCIGYMDKEYSSKCSFSKHSVANVLDRLSIFIKDNENYAVYMTFTKDGIRFDSMNNSGYEIVPYIGIENFTEYRCCVSVDALRKQVLAREGEYVSMLYGGVSESISIDDGSVRQIIALMRDPRNGGN